MHAGVPGDDCRVAVDRRDRRQVKHIDRTIHHQHACNQYQRQHQVHGFVDQQRRVFGQRALDGKIQAVAKRVINPQDEDRDVDGRQRHIKKRHPRFDRRGHSKHGHEKT
jgi:hypothetical protein